MKLSMINILENTDEKLQHKTFLGYHSSKRNMKSGLYKSSVLNVGDYSDIIRNAYMEIISDNDKNLENNDIDKMNKVFDKYKYGFTFVSDHPIEGSSFQPEKYKYGNHLYEVYGNGNEILLDDPNEIGATIVVSKTPLYFKQLSDIISETKKLSMINILSENTYKVYHGTNEKFDRFNFKKATQGIVWFTDNIDVIKNQEHGGMGNKFIMTRYITLNNPAGWDEYDKYGLQQLQDRGYDGAILPSDRDTTYFVFSPKSIHTNPPHII